MWERPGCWSGRGEERRRYPRARRKAEGRRKVIREKVRLLLLRSCGLEVGRRSSVLGGEK